jgi:hypothetical protein
MYVQFETECSAGRGEGYSDLHNTVDEHDVASSPRRFRSVPGFTNDRLWIGALRELRPRWLIRPVPRRTSSYPGLKEARI